MPPGGPLGVGGLDGLAVQKILDPDDPLDLGVVAAVGERHSHRHDGELGRPRRWKQWPADRSGATPGEAI